MLKVDEIFTTDVELPAQIEVEVESNVNPGGVFTVAVTAVLDVLHPFETPMLNRYIEFESEAYQ